MKIHSLIATSLLFVELTGESGNINWTNAGGGNWSRPSPTNGMPKIDGNFEQTLAGITVFDLGGNVPGSSESRLNITGSAHLGGCANVEVADGYLSGPGTEFQVMTFESRDGEFDCQNGFILLGKGRRLKAHHAPNSLTLSTLTAPEPTAVPLTLTVEDGAALVAWRLEFSGYELYWNTNLSQMNWTLIPSLSNRHIDPPPLPPEKYFLVLPRK